MAEDHPSIALRQLQAQLARHPSADVLIMRATIATLRDLAPRVEAVERALDAARRAIPQPS